MPMERNVKSIVYLCGALFFLYCELFCGVYSAAQPFAPPQTKGSTFSVLNRHNPKGNKPEALLGERLFFETRFAQFFATHCTSDVNQPLSGGDPLVKTVLNPRAGVPYPGPFAGKSMNCRSCHFVEEFSKYIAGGQRSYTDFTAQSPLPDRGDGRKTTPRNARSLVDALVPNRDVILLHDDGEFASAEALAKSTLTGREFGWLPSEHKQAVAHIARVIREDNGEDELGKRYGGSYSTLLMGTSPEIPAAFRLPAQFRLNTKSASDQQILERVAQLIGAYLKSLELERNADGVHTGSAYDRFLAKNNLPSASAPGESNEAYAQRLYREVEAIQSPQFVKPYERSLRLHPHVFQFGEVELKGLKLFLRQGARPARPEQRSIALALFAMPFGIAFLWRCKGKQTRVPLVSAIIAGCCGFLLVMSMTTLKAAGNEPREAHTGNCVTCHQAPEFTDFKFHNTGAAQEEYDAVHGEGSFTRLQIPSFIERRKQPDRFLPPTPQHPKALGVFRLPASRSDALAADLGLWNVFANSDFPEPQAKLEKLLCTDKACDPRLLLPKTIALFRTPSLRDLGHSAPYLHTGRKATLEDVLHFYMQRSSLMREGKLRNGDPELSSIELDEDDATAVAAFLRSLDEDYDN
jgi:hypothetical protein